MDSIPKAFGTESDEGDSSQARNDRLTGCRPIQPVTYLPKTLRSELRRRNRLPVTECVEIGLALTAALEHLHQNGLVHRDIKPSNVIFVNGQPKLADIGLVTDRDATMSFVGTEGYVPREGPGSPPADIYGLGKVLYEIATGKDRLDFPELPTDLGAAAADARLLQLNEVFVKSCEADADKRYRTATQMHADLDALQCGKSPTHVQNARHRFAVTATACLLTVAVALGIYAFRTKSPKINPNRQPPALSLASTNLTVFRHSGVVSDNMAFENLEATQDGDTVRLEFDYRIASKNESEINQMLVAANGKVVAFVSEGIVGKGKKGHAKVAFKPCDYASGRCQIEIGACFDYTSAQAKESFESEKKGGYRLEVGYVDQIPAGRSGG
jgi:serine/threonine protein kinase